MALINTEDIASPTRAEHEQMLLALANLIVPPSEDGRMPGAGDLGVHAGLYDVDRNPWIVDGLHVLDAETRAQAGREFSTLSAGEQQDIVNGVRRRLLTFFTRLAREVVTRYYQHDRVLEMLGVPVRAPFPGGYRVEPGDLTLLEPVWQRARLYRE